MGPVVSNAATWIILVCAVLRPAAAFATPPASPDEMMCVPSYFVLATVLQGAAVDTIDLPLSIKVEDLLAAKGPVPSRNFQKGDVLAVTIPAYSSDDVKAPKPSDYQGTLDTPETMKTSDVIKSLVGRKYVFGIKRVDEKPLESQIWTREFFNEVMGHIDNKDIIRPSCATLIHKDSKAPNWR